MEMVKQLQPPTYKIIPRMKSKWFLKVKVYDLFSETSTQEWTDPVMETEVEVFRPKVQKK